MDENRNDGLVMYGLLPATCYYNWRGRRVTCDTIDVMYAQGYLALMHYIDEDSQH